MRIKLLVIGPTDHPALKELQQEYLNRLQHYIKFDYIEIPDLKKNKARTVNDQKDKEGEVLLSKIVPADILILLDEVGKPVRSEDFAEELQGYMNQGHKQLVFAIGGPYGFSTNVYERANRKLSLSAMTFSHQMIRVFFIEQVYRAFTILRNEPYHHR